MSRYAPPTMECDTWEWTTSERPEPIEVHDVRIYNLTEDDLRQVHALVRRLHEEATR